MLYTFFNKKTGSGARVIEQLSEEFLKTIIKQLKRRKVYAKSDSNILTADITEIVSWSSKDKNVKRLLCVIDVSTKYVQVKPLKY